MRRYRLLLLLVLLGVVPITVLVVGVWLYFGEEEEAPLEPAVVAVPPEPAAPPPVEVLAAARALPVGTLLTANDITYVAIDPTDVFPGHMRRDTPELSTVVGSVVRTELPADWPLTGAALVRPGQDGFLAAVLIPSHRAITIVVNWETSHAGLISPGDRVDVIFTMQGTDDTLQPNSFSRTFLEDIRVVAVNRRVENIFSDAGPEESGGNQRGVGNTVTLEVLPSEADQLVLASSRGSLSLALRPLGQSARAGWRPPTGLRTLMPPPATQKIKPVRVQVFRGNNREEVLLAK